MKFKDHFSGQAADYAQFRPRYPEALFRYLSALAPSRGTAWDCATGNGQAAVALAAHFERVIATDASGTQIANAEPHEGVEYRTAPAEQSGIASGSVGLVTVAQALHWFDIPAFVDEAKRVLQPRGIIACWTYNLLSVTREIDALVQEFYATTTGPFWPPEREIVEAGYQTIDFPFDEVTPPPFQMQTLWTVEQLLGYLRTWSATQKFIAARGFDPVSLLGDELREHWQPPESARLVTWPLSMRVGRVIDQS